MDGRTLLERAYSVDNRPPVRTFGERPVHRRLTRAASLLVISVSSIGLWVAICSAVTALTSPGAGPRNYLRIPRDQGAWRPVSCRRPGLLLQ
jgi:hypothetical protein